MDEPGPSGSKDFEPVKPESSLVALIGNKSNNRELLQQEAKYEPGVSNDVEKSSIYMDDPTPKWYKAVGENISKTIIPKKLPEAFANLPIFDNPNASKMDLPNFLDAKVKEFVGLGFNDEQFANLADWCSPERLKTDKDLLTSSNIPNQTIWLTKTEGKHGEPPEGRELYVVRKTRIRNNAPNKMLYPYCRKLRYRGLRLLPLDAEEQDPRNKVEMPPPETLLEPGKDLIYKIRIYRPFPHHEKSKSINPSMIRHSVLNCDLVLSGRLPLTVIRDRIMCANDYDTRLDMSDRLDDVPNTTAKELFPSGFLFINNTFYVDTRGACVDLTAGVRRWAEADPRLGSFPVRDMCKMRIDQLHIKLGHPEVYVHQGACEHLFTFSEIRLLNYSDPLKLSHYPVHTEVSLNQTVYCTTCADFPAKWIVTDYERVPFDPAFFCEACFKMYCYKDGEKIGKFKAFLYRGNELSITKPYG